MMLFILLPLLLCGLMLAWHFLTISYLNPYKLTLIFGKKGSGKTTNLVKLALKHRNKWNVFSSEDLNLDFVTVFNASEIGTYDFPENSLILVDEVGMIWDNRNFKKFDNATRDFFKLQRHHKCKVILFSQSFDVDKKIRDLTDNMYLQVNVGRVFSYGKRINRHIVLTEATSEQASSISENLSFDSFLLFWCGSRTLTFIPKYKKYFDSFAKKVGAQNDH